MTWFLPSFSSVSDADTDVDVDSELLDSSKFTGSSVVGERELRNDDEEEISETSEKSLSEKSSGPGMGKKIPELNPPSSASAQLGGT